MKFPLSAKNYEVIRRKNIFIFKMDFVSAIFLVVLAAKNFPNETDCGVNSGMVHKKIVNGSTTAPSDWPWMASIILADSKAHFCGGTLITHRHILTAAHCFSFLGKNDVKVRLGEYQLDNNRYDNPSDFGVIDMRKHQGYNPENYLNDIAVLKLDRSAEFFSTFYRPVCLPPKRHEFEGIDGIVIGWGRMKYGEDVPLSNTLQLADLPIWKQEECFAVYGNILAHTMICAGHKAGGLGTCQGDSGGPLLIRVSQEPRWYIAGIVSFASKCALPDVPAVFTRVNMYFDWIKENCIF